MPSKMKKKKGEGSRKSTKEKKKNKKGAEGGTDPKSTPDIPRLDSEGSRDSSERTDSEQDGFVMVDSQTQSHVEPNDESSVRGASPAEDVVASTDPADDITAKMPKRQRRDSEARDSNEEDKTSAPEDSRQAPETKNQPSHPRAPEKPSYATIVRQLTGIEGPNTRSKTKVPENEKNANEKVKKEAVLSVVEPTEAGFDDIEVTFHALVSSDFTKGEEPEVYVVFGPPLSDWEGLVVKMQSVGWIEEFTYVTGKYSLPKKYLEDNIPYKYYVKNAMGQCFEHIYLTGWSSSGIRNRLLKVPRDSGDKFNKYDDIICAEYRYNANKSRRRELASLTMMNTVNVEFILHHGIVESLHTLRNILSVHQKGGMKVIIQSTYWRDELVSFDSPVPYDPVAILKKYARLLWMKHVDSGNEEIAIIVFLVAIHEYLNLAFDKLEDYNAVFDAFQRKCQNFATSVQEFDAVLADPAVREKMSNAFVKVIKKYFYLVDNGKNDCDIWLWIYALPFMLHLTPTSAKEIAFEEWIRLEQRRSKGEPVVRHLKAMSPMFPHVPRLGGIFLRLVSPQGFILLCEQWEQLQVASVFDLSQIIRKLADSECLRVLLPHQDLLNILLSRIESLLDSELLKFSEDSSKLNALANEILLSTKNCDFPYATSDRGKMKVSTHLMLFLARLTEAPLSTDIQEQIKGVFDDNMRRFNHQFSQESLERSWRYWIALLGCDQFKEAGRGNAQYHFRAAVERTSPDFCFQLYLDNDGSIPEWVAQDLFKEACSIFKDAQKKGLFSSVKSFFLGEKQSALIRMLTKYLSSFDHSRLDVSNFRDITASDALCNVIVLVLEQDFLQMFDENIKARISKMKKVCRQLASLLQDGSLPLDVFQAFKNKDHLQKLEQLHSAFRKGKDNMHALPMTSWIDQRLKWLESFSKDVDVVKRFFHSMEAESISLKEFDEFTRNTSLNKLRLSDIEERSRKCVLSYAKLSGNHANEDDEEEDEEQERGDEECMDLIRRFVHRRTESAIFELFWADSLSEALAESSLTLEVLLDYTEPALENFDAFVEGLANSTARIGDVARYFKDFERQKIGRELANLSSFAKASQEWQDKAEDQIHTLLDIKKFESVASEIQKVSEAVGIKQAFPVVVKILQATRNKEEFESQQLGYLNQDLVAQGALFKNWSKPEIDCLSALVTCKKLFIWLRENIHSAQELKVFIDLASISAGESDMEVDRVMCFQAAVAGYAPFVFDLKDNCSFAQFLSHCADLFKNLGADLKLPEKLHDCNRNMAWFTDVNERHGSVETSSIQTVQLINRTGSYEVKAIRKHERVLDTNFSKMISLTHASRSDDSMDAAKKMTLGDLEELRSKLVLISTGKMDKAEVDRFCRTLRQIESIARKLNLLLEAGCVFFSQWYMKCYLQADKKVTVSIDFGHDSSVVRGFDNVELELDRVIGFMENVHEEWINYIYDVRREHHILNYYTTDQLVTLSSALASSFSRVAELPTEAIMLINYLCPSLDPASLLGTLKKTMQEENDGDTSSEDDEDGESDSSESEDEEAREEDKRQEVISRIERSSIFKELTEDYSFDHSFAIAAMLKFEGETDVEKIAQWCMDNNGAKDTLIESIMKDRLPAKSVEPQPAKASKHKPEPVPSVREERSLAADPPKKTSSFTFNLLHIDANSIEVSLKSAWDQFRKNINNVEATDFLSFEKLAGGLSTLMEEFGVKPARDLPKYLAPGVPNLVICPARDLHCVALMLYLNAGDEKPLPSLDEVLVCTPETQFEQVELICRRAFGDATGRIYTVLNAHCLSYDVSLRIEDLFGQYVKSHDYRLVFISSKEENERSCVATAFEKHAATVPNLPEPAHINALLKRHMQFSNEEKNSASRLDPECCLFRLVSSEEVANGKSLYIRQTADRNSLGKLHSTQIHQSDFSTAEIVAKWLDFKRANPLECSVFSVDFACSADVAHKNLVFSLAILKGILNSSGMIWMCSDSDHYMVEVTFLSENKSARSFFNVLPTIYCQSPHQSLEVMKKHETCDSLYEVDGQILYLFDNKVYASESVQRPYQYLSLHRRRDPLLEHFVYGQPQTRDFALDCLEIILHFCPVVQNPSWREVVNFVSFLNVQLLTTEESVFCDSSLMAEDLPGFKNFMVDFLVQMAKDFATRSVTISDESQGEGFSRPVLVERRSWEESPHPYIFFNEDHHSISFYGLHIDRNLSLVAERTQEILKPSIMSRALYQGLVRQGVVFNKSFDTMSRQDKLVDLCKVLDVDPIDPDPTYELTYDNVMKMLAIFMRFRAAIAVVIMGETGCGKTRLIKFMCDLQRNCDGGVENMLILKVHGGTTEDDIAAYVDKAVKKAEENTLRGVKQTVLFFDEANTTNAMGLIKSIMCDYVCLGRAIPRDVGLQFVAAVNPYRQHSEEMIKKLENAGLGYHIKAENTKDTIGKIPLRRLVYRVREIPRSMYPLIWDFGFLRSDAERKYIRQMIGRQVADGSVSEANCDLLLNALCAAQDFMRQEKDECSFVSLRDVERTLTILGWFGRNSESVLQPLKLRRQFEVQPEDFVLNLVLSLGVSYYSRLDSQRRHFAARMGACFTGKHSLGRRPAEVFVAVIDECQTLFVSELRLETNIAKNDALKENVWMMSICMELRIPLFLVGKPGSSKSLAKTVIADVMQGNQSYSDLYKNFKEVHMVSFQCSPLATANGILGTFKQCQKFQQERDLEKFTSVVVLDEIGLAEDSPKMPLKALHPLLEDGCIDERAEPYKKVAFIGISNWALDPAKMNRGILVSRGVPSEEQLAKSALGICSNDADAKRHMTTVITKLTKGYFSVYQKQGREYFGLRDFYSVVKMVFQVAKREEREPSAEEIQLAVQRNFGGYFGTFDPADAFFSAIEMEKADLKMASPRELISQAIVNENEDTRYILLLTKNNIALQIIQDQGLLDTSKTLIMFGSSFPRDQDYTQICSNINQIKIAMELGKTVVLCNMNNLYESLYDCLNQNYVMLGGKRYVDLGLGTHRVKCRVHEDFRLIVVAEDTEVYEKFPIPLINRLEKHFLGMETLLEAEQSDSVARLKHWVHEVCEIRVSAHEKNFVQYKPADVFIGYHDDVIASIMLRLWPEGGSEHACREARRLLLQCATPDAISRLSETRIGAEEQLEMFKIYYLEQQHGSLGQFLSQMAKDDRLVQVTTNSRALTLTGKVHLASEVGASPDRITLLSLSQIETKDQFSQKVKSFLETCDAGEWRYLLVQVDIGYLGENLNLTESARYVIREQFQTPSSDKLFRIVLVLHIPRVAGGCFRGMSASPWVCVHVDELIPHKHSLNVSNLKSKPLAAVLSDDKDLLRRLLHSSLPKAVSLVRNAASSRTAEQIECLLDIFEGDDDFSSAFKQILQEKVLNLLAAQSDKMHNPDKWLVKMSISSEFLREGNSFQKAIWLHMCNVVTPLLRDVIEFLDVDCGLKLSTKHSSSWIGEAYLGLLRVADVVTITEAAPLATASGNFEAGFPLSRYVVSAIDAWSTLHNAPSNAQLEAIMEQSPLSQVMNFSFGRGFTALQLFISDFVRIKFPNLTSNEAREILCRELFEAAKKQMADRRRREDDGAEGMNGDEDEEDSSDDSDDEGSEDDEDDSEEDSEEDDEAHESSAMEHSGVNESATEDNAFDFVTPVDVHSGFVHSERALHFLYSLLSAFPQLTRSLIEKQEEHLGQVHVVGFLEVLKLCSPQPDNISTDANRKEWLGRADRVSVFYHLVKSLDCPGPKTMRQIDLEYERLVVEKLYVEHVCCGCEDNLRDIIAKKLKLLHISLNEPLKSESGFKKLINVLHKVNEEAAKHYFSSGQDTCAICLEDLQLPVLLPCNHATCKKCLVEHLKRDVEKVTCPAKSCRSEIPKDFEANSSKEFKKAVELHKAAKGRLNAFFMDVLQRFVYRDDPDPRITQALLSFVVTKNLPNDVTPRTKIVSPFVGHCVDATPVVRSFVLQLILKQGGGGFDRQLEEYLQQECHLVVTGHLKMEFHFLILNCLEDYYLTQGQLTEIQMIHVLEPAETFKLLQSLESGARGDEVSELVAIAKTKVAFTTVAAVLRCALDGQLDQLSFNAGRLLKEAVDACQRSRSAQQLKRFLVRLAISLFSKDMIHEWKTRGTCSELMPDELLSAAWNERDDFFLLVGGRQYKAVKDAVRRCLTVGESDAIDALLRMQTPAALAPELSLSAYFLANMGDCQKTHADKLLEITQGCKVLRDICTEQLTKGDNLVALFRPNSMRETSALAIVHHLRTVFVHLRQDNCLTNPLISIMLNPNTVPLLPTMKQDDSVEVMGAARGVTRFYTCRNGHAYGIGDCGHPVADAGGTARCPTCKEPIGGRAYNQFADSGLASEQVGQTQIQDATQSGHILGEARPNERSVAERKLDGLQVAVVRFLLHSAMAIGAANGHVDALVTCIKPTVAADNVPGFLLRHLCLNLQQIANALGKSEDEAQALLHSVIHAMSTKRIPARDVHCTTKEGRARWEEEFSKQFISAEMCQQLDARVRQIREEARSDQSAAENVIWQILNETSSGSSRPTSNPRLWYPRSRIDLASLPQRVGPRNLRAECPILQAMLDREATLAHVQHLPQILELQAILRDKFERRLDNHEVADHTVVQFLQRSIPDNLRTRVEALVKIFLGVFNSLSNDHIFPSGLIGTRAKSYCQGQPLGLGSPAEVLFASEHESGQCAWALIKVLVEAHNILVRKHHDEAKTPLPIAVAPRDLSGDQMVVFQRNDLQLLLLANSEYELRLASDAEHTAWKPDLVNLERRVIEKFISGRPLIDENALLKFHFRNDEVFSAQLSEVLPQEVLPHEVRRQMETTELRQLSDLCELLFHAETARDILLKLGASGTVPDEPLLKWMKKMRIQLSMECRNLRGLHLRHLDDLLSFLRIARAKKMILSKQNPFALIPSDFHVTLTDAEGEHLVALTRAVQHEVILGRMFRFITEGIGGKRDFAADGTLRDFVYAFLEESDDGVAKDLAAALDPALKNKHAIDLFKRVVHKAVFK